MNNILTDAIRADGEYAHLFKTLKSLRKTKPMPVIAAGLCDGATDALTVSLLGDMRAEKFGTTLIVCSEEKECMRTLAALKSPKTTRLFP